MSAALPDWTPVVDAIHGSKRCFVTSHIDPEGDSLGSQLALASVLRDLGKEVFMVDGDVPPERYAFMPMIGEVVQPDAVRNVEFDTAFVVDCGSVERIGSVQDLLPGRRVVNIDHHRSNTQFGDINFVAPDACATGFLIYELNKLLGLQLDVARATNMYVAIITDTGNFQYSNTDSYVLRVAADLIDTGIDPSEMSRSIFSYKPMRALKLLGEALRSLHTVREGKIGAILLDRGAFERAGAEESDTEGVVNFAKRVRGTDAGVLLRETPSGEIKVSLRSDGSIDVDAVARLFGGGGHRNAAGARLPGPIDAAFQRLLEGFDQCLAPRSV